MGRVAVIAGVVCLATTAHAQVMAQATGDATAASQATAAPAPAAAPMSGTTTAIRTATPATPIPALTFFRRPDLDEARLSPSGRWLAVRVNGGGQISRYALAVFDVTGVLEPKVIAYFRDTDIGGFQWVNDERLIYDMVDMERGSGDRLRAPGLFSVSRDGSQTRQLIATRGSFITEMRTGGASRVLPVNHWLLHVPSGESAGGGASGDDVVVGEYLTDSTGNLTMLLPKLLNVVTGRAVSLAAGTPPNATRWLFDAAGTPRLAVVEREGRVSVHWRADPGNATRQAWAELSDAPAYQVPWNPAGLDRDGRLYVTVASKQAGRGGEHELRRFDFASGQPEPQAMVSTPGFDFTGGLLLSQQTNGRLLGVRVITDAESTEWLDPRLKQVQAEIDKRLPGRVNSISCQRCTEPDMTVLVRSYADQHPGEFWLWRGEASAPTLWRPVGLRRKDVEPARMASVELQRFAARDGRPIPVWITTPAITVPGRKPPAVLLAHGGPWLRGGNWAWSGLEQFLASRGYVVIAPEFRGSLGYGEAHFRAGWKHWGTTMQDDLADAVAWAASKQLIDPQRVCIAGASYGGYATLMSLVRHPDTYRCGAAWVAVAEPTLLFKWGWESDMDDESRLFRLPQLIGDPQADAQLLRDASPVLQAARIKVPVLLAYGERDRRVPLEHGERMRAALRAAGNDPQWVVYPGEGHSWALTATQLDFAQRLEKFLADNLR